MSTIDYTTTTQVAAPAMVRADSIVHEGFTTISKVIGAGAIAKAEDKTTATVKAEHYARQGAALALAAAVTGKGRAAAVNAYANAEIDALVNTHGQINVFRAIATVARILDESVTVTESVRADGQRIVKLSDWRALGETISKVLAKPDTAKARRARYESAAKFMARIDAQSAFKREAKALTA